jgi:hypothetical protein
MSHIVFSILLICCTSSFKSNATVDIASVRSMFQQAASDEVACKKMIRVLAPYDEKKPLLLGYKGSGTMMMAKHVFSPFSKLSYFKKGKQMLESAINTDDKNFELRFLRFTAQTNIPSFLGYDSDIQKDKEFILNHFLQIKDTGLKEFVLPILIKSKYLNNIEKQQLNNELR